MGPSRNPVSLPTVTRQETGRQQAGQIRGAASARPRLVGWRPRTLDPSVASVRIRCLSPLATLRARGYPVELFRPDRAARYGAVVFSKAYDHRSCEAAKRLRDAGVRVALDLCDNHFYNPGGDPALTAAGVQLRRMIRQVDELIASTDALADVLRAEAPAETPVRVVGDGVEEGAGTPGGWLGRARLAWSVRALRAFHRRAGVAPERRLVWYGIQGGAQSQHGMRDLARIRPFCERLAEDGPVSLTVISNSRRTYEEHIRPWDLPTHYAAWGAHTFDALLAEHAVAVIPITSNPFTVCKSNNRVTTALRAGLAVVADSIPSYREFADAVVLDDWDGGLRRYLGDPSARARDVDRGREIIAERWSQARVAAQWESAFDRLLG